MRAGSLLGVVAVLALLVLPIGGAQAQGFDVRGAYTIMPQAGDDVPKVIEALVEPMNFIKKPLARKRLRETNVPPQRIEIVATAVDVSVKTDDGETVRTPADGRPVEWKRKDGETFTVSTTWNGRVITRNFRADDGERANSYAFSPDGGTLTMTVVVTSPQLPDPLTYKLVYRRAF
jgi:hypothetical protein